MEYRRPTSWLADGVSVRDADYGRNFRDPTNMDLILNDEEFQAVFEKLGIIPSPRKFNFDQHTPLGTHRIKSWDILLEFAPLELS